MRQSRLESALFAAVAIWFPNFRFRRLSSTTVTTHHDLQNSPKVSAIREESRQRNWRTLQRYFATVHNPSLIYDGPLSSAVLRVSAPSCLLSLNVWRKFYATNCVIFRHGHVLHATFSPKAPAEGRRRASESQTFNRAILNFTKNDPCLTPS